MNTQKQPNHAMKNLDGIIEKIENHIGEKEKIREDALKASRDIIICCRKGIQQLHRNQIGGSGDVYETSICETCAVI